MQHSLSSELRLDLARRAIRAAKAAYAPYSHFRVGAALLTTDGSIITGCNVENASYGATNCAERTAVFKAVSEGYRAFKAIAVYCEPETGDRAADYVGAPCGICRQVLREFSDPRTFHVILVADEESLQEYTLQELLPVSFGPDDLASGT